MNEEFNPYANPQPPQNAQPNEVQQPTYQEPVYQQPAQNHPQQVYYEQVTVQTNREEAMRLRRERAQASPTKPVLGLVFAIIGLISVAFGLFVVMSYQHNTNVLRGESSGALDYSRAVGNNVYNMLLLVLNVPITGAFSILGLVFSILSAARQNKNKGLTTLALILSILACALLVFFIFFLHYKFQFEF